MTSKELLKNLREEYADNIDVGGITWWLTSLAEQLEMTPKELYDVDTDSGLLFELEQAGDLRLSLTERKPNEFDYLILLNGPRIVWD